ncbi:Sodium channel protein Nach [Danaus plexippus plexippus]|uniref:Sodium channel protein Nach n=1 Tax=Danaus plexippus plexippus TaxID=278856 RepID=A0A212EX37_DANPL|nr:Sodium channel protein Nach [Danaus plexippus plexippus]
MKVKKLYKEAQFHGARQLADRKFRKYPSELNATYIRRVINQLAAFSSADVPFDINDLENIEYLLDYNNLEIDNVTEILTATCQEILLKEISGSIQRVEPYTDNLSYDFENSLMFAVEQRNNSGNLDLDYKWLNLQTGHHYVDINENGTAITPGVEWTIKYTTKTVNVASDATNLNYYLRGCRLSSEPLKYFPIYHKTHCLLECEIERTMSRCQCLKLSHPKLHGMPLCRARRLTCSREATG